MPIRPQVLVAILLLLALPLLAAPLVPCPDCGRQVSSRALMCPACGCPGDAIAACTSPSPNEQTPAAPEPDRLLRLEVDQRTAFALPVRMPDGLFALAPLDAILGAETVTLAFLSTNTTIAYAMPEVAVSAPLVRFPITETNLTCWSLAPASAAETAVLRFTPPAGLAIQPLPSSPPALAVLDASTNLLSLFTQATGAPIAEPLPPSLAWQRIQPRDFREHGRLYLRHLRDPSQPTPSPWCHPVFEALARRLAAQEKKP